MLACCQWQGVCSAGRRLALHAGQRRAGASDSDNSRCDMSKSKLQACGSHLSVHRRLVVAELYDLQVFSQLSVFCCSCAHPRSRTTYSQVLS